MTIIDTPFNTSAKIPCLVSKAVSTVIRYYNFSNSRSLPEKRLELAEAQALSAHGIAIAVVFQQSQNRASHFSAANGERAGQRAFEWARDHIGQPQGSGIYFSVDFDASEDEVNHAIIPYFEGVRNAFAAQSEESLHYRVGAYGSGVVCDMLRNASLIELTWLSMSRGFRGTKQAIEYGNYHLLQKPPESQLCGLSIDYNEANPMQTDFGSFLIEDDAVTHTKANQFRVIARSGLRLRGGPGTNFDIIGGLKSGQVVHVTSIEKGWASIDIDGDGLLDGFASEKFLSPIISTKP